MISFFYFYSEIYNYYHNHLLNRLINFDINPINIDNIQAKNGHTFFGGVTIKIELLLECIKKNMGKHIIFSDATIFINDNNTKSLSNYFNDYMDNDLVFSYSHKYKNYCIAIILIKCSQDTFEFFNNVLNDIKNTNGWDQSICVEHIKNNTKLKIAYFDKRIICDYEFDNKLVDSYFIFKSWINHTDSITNNYNQRIETFYKYNLINSEEYIKNII